MVANLSKKQKINFFVKGLKHSPGIRIINLGEIPWLQQLTQTLHPLMHKEI